jgi:FkbM family methyltransferase
MLALRDKFRGIDHYQLNFATETATRLVYQKFVRAADTVIDCGASLGQHTSALARIVGADGLVHAFEPNPDHFARLLKLGRNVRLWPFAVGDALSVETLQIPIGLDGWASLVDLRGVLKDRKFVLRTTVQVRLDDLPEVAERAIRFLKIDIEQREFHGLQGMISLLERDRPLVILENGSERIRELCAPIGYDMYDFFGLAFQPEDSVLGNCVMFPRERWADEKASFMPTRDELAQLYEETVAAGAGRARDEAKPANLWRKSRNFIQRLRRAS